MTDVQIGMKLVGKRGDLLDTRKLRGDIARENQKFAKRVKRSFQRSTKTWAHPVVFHQETKGFPEPSCAVFATDLIYHFVSGGTAVRYAVMTDDFSPKTRPGSLDARPGSGGFSHLDMRNPRPGLVARDFPTLVVQKHQENYVRAIGDCLDRAAKD